MPSSHIYKTEMPRDVIDVDAADWVIDVDTTDCVIDVDAEVIAGEHAEGPSLDYLIQMATDEEAKVAEHERRVGDAWDAQFGHCFPDLMAH
jgi:hypothetical protein